MTDEAQTKTHYFDEWADQKLAARAALFNRELYNHYRNEEERAHRGHMEYAKWMLASLIAVHGGAIYAISGLRNVAPPSQSDFLIWGAAFNLGGVFLTLVSGLFAWLNLQMAEILYGQCANPAMLYRGNVETKTNPWIDRTMYLSAVTGCLSGLAFAISAAIVVVGLHRIPESLLFPG